MEFLIGLDKKLIYLFNNQWRNGFFDIAAPIISEIPLLIFLLVLFLTVYARFLKKNNKFAFLSFSSFPLFLVLSIVINNTLSDIIKYLADRARPYEALPSIYYRKKGEWLITPIDMIPDIDGSSMLSSHASNSMVVACVFYFYFARKFPILFLLPICVGWSRLYLGRHYVSDILVGGLLGFLVTYLVFKLLQKYFPQYYGQS